MRPAEKGNMNRRELFEMFARKCKSRAKVSIWIGLISLILTAGIIIFILNYHPQNPYCDDADIICFLTCFIVIGCALLLSIPYDYWYIKRIDILDTPAQLLCLLKKRTRFERICFIVPLLVSLACELYDNFRLFTFRTDLFSTIWALALAIALVLCTIHVSKPEKMTYKDEELIVDLEDLAEMK